LIRAVQPVHLQGGLGVAGGVVALWHAQQARCLSAGSGPGVSVAPLVCRVRLAGEPAHSGITGIWILPAALEPPVSPQRLTSVFGEAIGGSALGPADGRPELQWQPWPAYPPYAFQVRRWWPWVDWPPPDPPDVVEHVVEQPPERIPLDTRGSMLDLWT